MNISEIWMRLETLAHLRQLPQLDALRKKIESELAEHNASLIPQPAPVPVAPVAMDSVEEPANE
jgi:hypothetical protein